MRTFVMPCLLILSLTFGGYQWQEKNKYKRNVNNNTNSILTKASEDANSINSLLVKTNLAKISSQNIGLLAEIYKQSSTVYEGLSLIDPISTDGTDLLEPLSRIINTSYNMMTKSIDQGMLDNEDWKILYDVRKDAEFLSDELASLLNEDLSTSSILTSRLPASAYTFLSKAEKVDSILTVEEAIQCGNAFLEQYGFHHMTDVFYECEESLIRIDYVNVINDVIVYPDLLQLTINLTNGTVVSLETLPYITASKTREIKKPKLLEAQALELVSPQLKPTGTRLAIIKSDLNEEVLCYEFSGILENKQFYIYINADTGKQEKILEVKKDKHRITAK